MNTSLLISNKTNKETNQKIKTMSSLDDKTDCTAIGPDMEIYNSRGRLTVSLLTVDDVVEMKERSHHQTQTQKQAREADFQTTVSQLV